MTFGLVKGDWSSGALHGGLRQQGRSCGPVFMARLNSLREKPLRQKNHPSAAKAGLILQFLRHS
jgi:hypothetical protein